MQTGVRKDLLQVQQDLIIFESSCNKKKHIPLTHRMQTQEQQERIQVSVSKREKRNYTRREKGRAKQIVELTAFEFLSFSLRWWAEIEWLARYDGNDAKCGDTEGPFIYMGSRCAYDGGWEREREGGRTGGRSKAATRSWGASVLFLPYLRFIPLALCHPLARRDDGRWKDLFAGRAVRREDYLPWNRFH